AAFLSKKSLQRLQRCNAFSSKTLQSAKIAHFIEKFDPLASATKFSSLDIFKKNFAFHLLYCSKFCNFADK
ncbi:MAG: hypothetical protein J6W03_04735, partial [Bacteroidaceae bacterium]|nr:hypothetical protein [Bacteroidaceae bacterium]